MVQIHFLHKVPKALLISNPKPSLTNITASENAEQPYKFELQALVTYLRDRQGGLRRSDAERNDFFLPAEQFKQFDELAEGGEFSGTRVRYDYSYATETLTLILHGIKHEFIVAYLNSCLTSFIGGVKDKAEPSMANFAASLRPTLSAALYYPFKNPKGRDQRSPDVSFIGVKNAEYPVLVGEVAVSQTTKELHKRAQEYIEQTQGRIRTVITVDVDHPVGKGARLLVWRAKFGEDEKFEGVACGDAVEIRNKDGVKNPDSQAGLFLSLEDFGFVRGTDGEDTDLQSVADVNVANMDDLCKVLEYAEEVNEFRRVRKDLRTGRS
ncbi:hypothetical protein LTS17_008534 [Exophiala oligosperma]